MNRILIVVIGLIVVFGALAFLTNKKTAPTTQKPEEATSKKATSSITHPGSSMVIVTLTDSGFTPKDITIKAGTRVIWINKSGKDATVNSDDHPTHRLYPFLNLGEFPNGSSVQVVVEKPGKYSYHNHLNASQTGTITAE